MCLMGGVYNHPCSHCLWSEAALQMSQGHMLVTVVDYQAEWGCVALMQVAPFDLLAGLPEYTPPPYSMPVIDSA